MLVAVVPKGEGIHSLRRGISCRHRGCPVPPSFPTSSHFSPDLKRKQPPRESDPMESGGPKLVAVNCQGVAVTLVTRVTSTHSTHHSSSSVTGFSRLLRDEDKAALRAHNGDGHTLLVTVHCHLLSPCHCIDRISRDSTSSVFANGSPLQHQLRSSRPRSNGAGTR